MYPVSNAYKEAMHARVQSFRVTGTVGDVSFTDENILEGSLSITNQCSGNENIEIGQVYIGELNCTFLNLSIGRNNWYGKDITIYFGQRLADKSYEDIPLGVFTVAEAEYTESGVVIKAYDHMALLDKSCSSLATGTIPYNLAKIICDNCRVRLETTEAEFARFPNGRVTLAVYENSDISTYRDALSWLAQTCCCFATASRTGGIILKCYGGSAIDVIDDEHRFTGCSFSDFSTRYTGLSVVNIDKQTTSYYKVSPDNALTYNLGSNPYLQYAVSHSLSTMRQSVLNKLTEIDYVPFRATCIGNPAYDLGDVLIFSNGIADGTKQSVLTKYAWTYGKNYVMEGVGKNPALATGNSKTDKNISGLINQTKSSEQYICTVLRNGSPVNIGDGQMQSVLFSHYILTGASHVRFNFEVLLTVTATTSTENLAEVTINDNVLTLNPAPTAKFVTVKAIYKSDGQEITSRYPTETWQSGKHILTLQYDLDFDDAVDHTFDLWLEVIGGSVTIAPQDAYEVISSTGLAASNKWEGTFRSDDGNLYIVIDGTAHKIPDKIEIGRYPVKTTYNNDEPINYSGLIVYAVFGDGTKIDITESCSINPNEGSLYDAQEDEYIEISYTTWTVTYTTGFNLTHNYIVSFSIIPPTKVNYRYHEILDYTGLIVKANYRDGSVVDITDACTLNPEEGGLFEDWA